METLEHNRTIHTEKTRNSVDIHDIAFTNALFEVVKNFPGGSIGDTCQILSANWPLRSLNNGFLAKNIETDDYFQVVDKIDAEYRKQRRDLEFTILDWKEFCRCTEIIPELISKSSIPRSIEATTANKTESHPYMVLFAFTNLLLGCFMLTQIDGDSDDALVAIGISLFLIFLSVAGAIVSDVWSRVESLTKWKKALAFAAPVVGGTLAFIFAISLLLYSPGKKRERT